MATENPVSEFPATQGSTSPNTPTVKPVDKPTDSVVPNLNDNEAAIPSVDSPVPTPKVQDVKFEQDPTAYVQTRVRSLVYWEKPVRSATVLGSLLFVLSATQYYSLLHITAAAFTIVTSLNFVYVNTHKQSQRLFGGKSSDQLTNPHSGRLQTKKTLISRERVARTAELTVDVAEVVVHQVTRLVLIENNWHSGYALVVSYLLWTLAAHISTKYLMAAFLLGAFSIPPIYHRHQVVIDKHIAQYSYQARGLAQQYGNIAASKAKLYYDQAVGAVVSKTAAAKKAE